MVNEKSFERKIWTPQKSEKGPQGEPENSGDFRDIQATEYLIKELKETTTKYENDKRFKKTVEELKNLTQKQRMGLLIAKDNDDIGIGNYRIIEIINKKTSEKNFLIAEYPESEILVGEKILDNIRCLFISDEELTKEGFTEIFSHEDRHRTSLAGELRQQEKLELKKIFKEAKSYNEAHEKRTDVLLKYFYDIETAAEKQRQEKTYKDLKKIQLLLLKKRQKCALLLMLLNGGLTT